MVTEDHVKQANNLSGRQVEYVPASSVSFNTDGEVETTDGTKTTLKAKITDIDEVDSSVLNMDDEGKYPDDGLVLRVDSSIEVEKDDHFNIDGTRYEVFKTQNKEGFRGKRTGQHVFVQPQR